MTALDDVAAWRTAITDTSDHENIRVRGFSLLDLIEHADFGSAIYLVLAGRPPTGPQRVMINMLLVAAIDHGIAPSSAVTRMISASGVPLQAAVAGGLLTLGDVHGGAGEEYSRLLSEIVVANGEGADWTAVAGAVVDEFRTQGRRVPGYGHPLHPNGDPRAPVLVAAAQRLGVAGPHVAVAVALEAAIAARGSRRIALNIDGALGSIMLDLGLSWRHARALCIISRSCGLSAHAVEETVRERGWRSAGLGGVDYDGPEPHDIETFDRIGGS